MAGVAGPYAMALADHRTKRDAHLHLIDAAVMFAAYWPAGTRDWSRPCSARG
jgi:hypothetical protein